SVHPGYVIDRVTREREDVDHLLRGDPLVLLCERVALFDIHTDATIDVAALWENKGTTPEQVIDVLALTGDTVDNVPGVDGVGIKTAAQLIQQFGSMDGI